MGQPSYSEIKTAGAGVNISVATDGAYSNVASAKVILAVSSNRYEPDTRGIESSVTHPKGKPPSTASHS